MEIIQKIPIEEVPKTFDGLAKLYLEKILSIAKKNKASVVHVVPDRYREVSIKNADRARRGRSMQEPTMTINVYSEEQKTTIQWKRFLASGHNKDQLIEFFFNCWRKLCIENQDCLLVIGHDTKCHSILYTGSEPKVQSVPELFCSHEEADTRLLLQCRYAAKSNSSVVIQSPDTDVLVITMSKCHDIGANVFFVTGRGDQRRTIDITAMNKYFG